MLILLAPSQTKHQRDEIWTGNTDTNLTPDGIREATTLGTYEGGIFAARAFVAPATHIQEFADIVLTGEYTVLPELTDRSMGSLTARSYRETMAEFPRRNWLAWHRSYWIAPPEGESFFDISDRVLTAFRTKVIPIPSTENVCIIAAPDVLRILIGYLSKADEAEVPKVRVEPCMPHIINGDL